MRALNSLCLVLLLAACREVPVPETIEIDGVDFFSMQAERLPDLTIPRQAHRLFYVNGELTVLGGHGTGFKSTSTAEYLSGGRWHLVESLYPHDAGGALLLRNGKILVAGGYAEDFGIGQTWGVELYSPASHSFSHLPILASKRTHLTLLEMDGGRVLASGNWYHPDAIEMYMPGNGFQAVKEVSFNRNQPFLLRSAPDNALVFGFYDNYQQPQEGPLVVDRLKGEPFSPAGIPEGWHPLWPRSTVHQADMFQTAPFTYLLPFGHRDGRIAAVSVRGEDFSFVPLEKAIPAKGPWGEIRYDGPFQVDTAARKAWLLGTDWDHRVYLTCIEYGKEIAPVYTYYSEPLYPEPSDNLLEQTYVQPVGRLLPDGRYALVGGVFNDGYSALPCNWMLYPGVPYGAGFPWGWVAAAVAVLLLSGAFTAWRRGRIGRKKEPDPIPDKAVSSDLMSRIQWLMEERNLYLRKDLRLTDVATELGTNSTYISACVNSLTGSNFPTYLNGYRIRHAQALMKEHPDWLLAQVAEESGFPNETTFLRNFKAQTGLSPSEWKTLNI